MYLKHTPVLKSPIKHKILIFLTHVLHIQCYYYYNWRYMNGESFSTIAFMICILDLNYWDDKMRKTESHLKISRHGKEYNILVEYPEEIMRI